MTRFRNDPDLQIGTVFEVAGSAIKIALSRDVRELSRSHGGRVYDVGQVGSLLKLHLGRRIIFVTVTLLRLQSDEETAAISESLGSKPEHIDHRVVEADLLGEGLFNAVTSELSFKRGVSSYPLPLQPVHLVTRDEHEELFRSAEGVRHDLVDYHVPIGTYVGATRVECRANIDKLFAQHCAVLGSTGSGKSSAVAAIIHSVLESDLREGVATRPNIILIDPHNEYSTAFGEQAHVYRAYNALNQADADANLRLPYWLMSGDEFRSLLIGKTEFEATSQANTVYKALTHARLHAAGLVESATGDIPETLPVGRHPEEPLPVEGVDEGQILAFDRDKPRPFSLREFRAHIENRQAKRPQGDGWQDITPSEFQREYSSILNKFRVLTTDPRLSFLMEELDEEPPSLSEILAQFLPLDAADQPGPIKIIDISGLPSEVAGPLTGAIARLLFNYKLFQERAQREADPILFVCEEAHRYVPNRGEAQYEVAQSAIRRIAREGRKYGIGLMLVSQRPADVEGTVISQCNSWIVLRLSNSADQAHVTKFLPDALSGMTRMLSSLPRQEALFVGEAAAIPAKIQLRTLQRDQLPNSEDISFSAGWTSGGTTEESLNATVQRMSN